MMLTAGVGKRFQHIFSSNKLHERPGIQSQATAAVFAMDTDMDTSWKDRLVRTRIVYPTMSKEWGKQFQLHSTFAKTKEMLNGC